jgi:hypothetical protein
VGVQWGHSQNEEGIEEEMAKIASSRGWLERFFFKVTPARHRPPPRLALYVCALTAICVCAYQFYVCPLAVSISLLHTTSVSRPADADAHTAGTDRRRGRRWEAL